MYEIHELSFNISETYKNDGVFYSDTGIIRLQFSVDLTGRKKWNNNSDAVTYMCSLVVMRFIGLFKSYRPKLPTVDKKV
jgi:hypothetical protein